MELGVKVQKKIMIFLLYLGSFYICNLANIAFSLDLKPAANIYIQYEPIYVVRTGDSLWKITDKLTNKPWLWSLIFVGNQDIKDPNIIKPGDKISLKNLVGGNDLIRRKINNESILKNDTGLHIDVKKYTPRSEFGYKVGNQRNISHIGMLLPIWQDTLSIFYGNILGMIDNKDAREINLGLGFRKLFARNIFGSYLYYDRRKTAYGNLVQQLTIGAEWLREYIEMRGNVYIPHQKEHVVNSGYSVITRHDATRTLIRVISNKIVEVPMWGFDVELGTAIPKYDRIQLFSAFYHFDGPKVSSMNGIRLRTKFNLNNFFSIDAEISHDGVRKIQKFLGFKFEMTFGSKKQNKSFVDLNQKMTQFPVRDIDAITNLNADKTIVYETRTGKNVAVLVSEGASGITLEGNNLFADVNEINSRFDLDELEDIVSIVQKTDGTWTLIDPLLDFNLAKKFRVDELSPEIIKSDSPLASFCTMELGGVEEILPIESQEFRERYNGALVKEITEAEKLGRLKWVDISERGKISEYKKSIHSIVNNGIDNLTDEKNSANLPQENNHGELNPLASELNIVPEPPPLPLIASSFALSKKSKSTERQTVTSNSGQKPVSSVTPDVLKMLLSNLHSSKDQFKQDQRDSEARVVGNNERDGLLSQLKSTFRVGTKNILRPTNNEVGKKKLSESERAEASYKDVFSKLRKTNKENVSLREEERIRRAKEEMMQKSALATVGTYNISPGKIKAHRSKGTDVDVVNRVEGIKSPVRKIVKSKNTKAISSIRRLEYDELNPIQ